MRVAFEHAVAHGLADLERFMRTGDRFLLLAEGAVRLAEPDQGDHRRRAPVGSADDLERTGVLLGGVAVAAERMHDAAERRATFHLGPKVETARGGGCGLRVQGGVRQTSLICCDSGMGGQCQSFGCPVAERLGEDKGPVQMGGSVIQGCQASGTPRQGA